MSSTTRARHARIPPPTHPRAQAFTARSRALLESMTPVLRAQEKRAALLADRAEYEAMIANPDRLLAKGSSAA